MHPSGAWGATSEAVYGPAQFKLRAPEASPHALGSDSCGELGAFGRSPPAPKPASKCRALPESA
eukprot:8407476-Alexandrium_andersonii.AAC.1